MLSARTAPFFWLSSLCSNNYFRQSSKGFSAPNVEQGPFLTSLRMSQGHQRLSSLRSNKSVPNVTSYATRASKAQLPTVKQVRSCVTSYANKGIRGSARHAQTSPLTLCSLRSNKSVPSSLRMPQGHHPLSSLRSNNAHAIGIGIHCDMHGKDFTWRKCEDAVRAETASSHATCIIDIGKPLRDFLMSYHDTQSSILASKFYRPMACA